MQPPPQGASLPPTKFGCTVVQIGPWAITQSNFSFASFSKIIDLLRSKLSRGGAGFFVVSPLRHLREAMCRGRHRDENRVGVVRTSLIDLASLSPILSKRVPFFHLLSGDQI